MNSKEEVLIANNVYLWIYSSKNGQLKRFSHVDIFQQLNPYSKNPIKQYNATSNIGVNRLVNGIEYGVWYYPRYQEYLIWSKKNDSERIKRIFVKTLRQRAKERITESLKTLKKEHDVLEIASSSLLTNCVITIKNYEDVETIVNQYFFNL